MKHKHKVSKEVKSDADKLVDNSAKEKVSRIVSGIRAYFRQANFSKAVIGLSGGIDSAVSCKLAVLALGKENVTAVLMPEVGLTKEENVHDAREFAESLDIKYILQPINKMLVSYDLNVPINELAKANLKARIRANILYSYANTFNALVIGTGNKTEAIVGYGTKHGDLACDIFVIGDLYKKEVYELARFLKIPEPIIKKVPTAELKEGQTYEKELGISYEELDKQLLSCKYSKPIAERIKKNQHKRVYPFVVKAD